MPKETAMRLSIVESDIEMAKHNKLHLLENPNRPGPDYYKDCKKLDSEEEVDLNETLTEEDLKWQKAALLG